MTKWTGRATKALIALRSHRWCVLDTETTGLGPYDEVIEIGVVDDAGNTLADLRARPVKPITARSLAVHGLDAATLASERSWPSVWPALEARIRDLPVLAWNAAFDLRLLRQTCARYHLPLRTPRFLCLREVFREQHPVARGTLDAACLVLGLAVRPSHRALADAKVARQVALALLASHSPLASAAPD